MLKGISKLISPELLKTLHEMGHGDEILLADAHFPGHTLGHRVLRADGLEIAPLLEAILPLFELDRPEGPLAMMQTEQADVLDPHVEADYMAVIHRYYPHTPAPSRIARAEFYQRAKCCFAVVVTGETRPYGNLLLKKGVTVT